MLSALLPKSSWVEVLCYRLKKPVLVWQAPEFNDVDNFSCLPQSYECDSLYGETQILHADRYGGHGAGDGGGSGRCATLNDVQIKGVGQTPLLSLSRDPFHSSGTMTLHEAAREVIYERIYAGVLPYGTVRSLAIVCTGGRFEDRHYSEAVPSGTPLTMRRSLLVRDFALRPGHFLRNTVFGPHTASGNFGYTTDAWRTRTALENLTSAFEVLFVDELGGITPKETIAYGLLAIVDRFAAQAASSFARRLPHGALNCTNISLDGRFLDFGGTSYASAYRKWAFSAAWPDARSQHQGLMRTIQLMSVHLEKYLSHQALAAVPSGKDLLQRFLTRLDFHVETEYLLMFGLTRELASEYPIVQRRNLLACIRRLYEAGSGERFTAWPAWESTRGDNPPPRNVGRYNLNATLISLFTNNNCSSDDRLVNELRVQVNELIRWVLSKGFAATEDEVRGFLGAQVARTNAELDFLYRDTLNGRLVELEDDPVAMNGLIDQTVNRALYHLGQTHPGFRGVRFQDQLCSFVRRRNDQ